MIEPVDRRTPTPGEAVQVAFGIVHKRALGLAIGLTVALLVAALTVVHLILAPGPDGPNLGLLAQYFYGYGVTPAGVGIGAFWGFVTGFVGGWFLAFTRNFVLALQIVLARARGGLDASRDILDHI